FARQHSAVAPRSTLDRREAPMNRERQLPHLGSLRCGSQDQKSIPGGAEESDNRLRSLHLFHARIVEVDLGPGIEPQIDCKCVLPSPLVPKHTLTTPSLRITSDTVWRYSDAFQSIGLDVSILLAEWQLGVHPNGSFLRRSDDNILAYHRVPEAP